MPRSIYTQLKTAKDKLTPILLPEITKSIYNSSPFEMDTLSNSTNEMINQAIIDEKKKETYWRVALQRFITTRSTELINETMTDEPYSLIHPEYNLTEEIGEFVKNCIKQKSSVIAKKVIKEIFTFHQDLMISISNAEWVQQKKGIEIQDNEQEIFISKVKSSGETQYIPVPRSQFIREKKEQLNSSYWKARGKGTQYPN